MTESEVVKAIRKQRDEIARNELDTLRRMARLWVPSYRYLQEQVSALMRIIQDKRDKGETVEMEYIYSLKRYQTMMEQAAVTIRKYNKAIAGLINGAEAEATDLGQKNAQQLVSIAEPDHEMWTRVNRRETTIAAGMTAEGAPLDSLLEKSFGEMKEGLEQALITGISTGQGSSWIVDQMMQAAAIPERRALLIARTEVNRAYRQSNWNQMRSSRAVLGYRRMCHKGTACFACLMLDKEFYPVDEEPTDHPNGKCSFVPVTRHFDPGNDPSWQGGREYFDSLPEEAQRKLMGPGRFDLWKREGVDPRDMVWIKPNKTWGGSPAIIPLRDIPKNISFRAYSMSELKPFVEIEPDTKTIEDFNVLKRRLYRDYKIRADENVKYLDFENFKESVSGFTQVLKEHPDLQFFVNKITVDRSLGTRALLQVNGKGLFSINPLYLGNSTQSNLEKVIKDAITSGDAIKNFTIRSAGYHEAGHLFVDLYSMKHPEIKNTATVIIKKAMQILGKRNKSEEILKISNRAIISNDELIAEAVSDYYTNKNDSAPLSKAIYKVVTGI